jgi:hypothetical protein
MTGAEYRTLKGPTLGVQLCFFVPCVLKKVNKQQRSTK